MEEFCFFYVTFAGNLGATETNPSFHLVAFN
jgi:hypothetical protein